MVRAPDALEERADRAWRAELADELDGPDVDAELERGSGHERAEVAGAQPGLNVATPCRRQRAVVGGHHEVRVFHAELVGREALGQLMGDALGHPAGVDEDERCAVVEDVLGDPRQHVAHLVGGDGCLELS